MNDRPQQRSAIAARRGGQGQPGQDFSLCDLPVKGFLEYRWQFVERPRLVERLVQPIDDLAPR